MANKKTFRLGIVWHQVRDDWRKEIEEYVQELWDKNIEKLADTELEITAINSVTNEQVRLKAFKRKGGDNPAFGTENGKDIARQAIPLNTLHDLGQFHMVLFAYDAEKSDLWGSLYDSRGRGKGKGYVTSWSFFNELYLDTEYTELEVNNRPSEGLEKARDSVIHEMMHAIVKRCQRGGLSEVVDHMDSTIVDGKVVEYYKNSKPFTKDGNYQRTLASVTEHDGWSMFTSFTRSEAIIAQYEKNIAPKPPVVETPVAVTNVPARIIVHHTGGTDKNPLEDTSHHTAAIIKNWHVNGLGWSDIGYHWVIEKDGKVVAGRDERTEGAHTIGQNRSSIGICLSGNFDATLPTEAQTKSLAHLMERIMQQYNIAASEIHPHRDYSAKSCYGKLLGDTWARDLMTPPVVVEPARPLAGVATIDMIDELKYRIKTKTL